MVGDSIFAIETATKRESMKHTMTFGHSNQSDNPAANAVDDFNLRT
jgi:hypothetical protein